MIKNLSQLKKYLSSPEAEVEVIYYQRGNHKWMNVKRKVEKVQTISVKFVGGSWFEFGKASDYIFNGDNTFHVLENGKILLTYRYY